MQLLWSEDRDTGPSPRTPGILTAFLVVSKEDEELVNASQHDLVFRERVHRKTNLYPGQLKRVNNVLVCPAEQWYIWNQRHAHLRKAPPKIQCSTCSWCFRTKLRHQHTGELHGRCERTEPGCEGDASHAREIPV
jgi:hypothetical protein